MSSLLQAWALPAAFIAIANLSATWYKLVSEHVHKPYLDEFFHVPQAQRYCENDYTWDPKITTPPGLYLASLLFKPIAGCSTSTLRALNVGAICLICVLSYQIRRTLRLTKKPYPSKSSPSAEEQTSLLDAHTALNISLFPPLFFFSGLYYTDVLSTLVVLASYSTYLSQRRSPNSLLSSLLTINIGVLALLFRQTNIFWVAVFPAGLSVIDTLKEHDDVFDFPVEDAGLREYFAFLFYLPRDILMKRPVAVIKAVLPYVALLGIFAAFVVWNRGVVLGDKSAHVATVHVPQMLYLWPYMVFFSAPLVLPIILRPVVSALPKRPREFVEGYLTGSAAWSGPGVVVAVMFTVVALAAVHYNTIIHPYTLADNRHFVFYVFRIILRHPYVKYAAVPVYYVCAWLAVQNLGAPSSPSSSKAKSGLKKQGRAGTEDGSVQISWVVVWTAATALSVITAPLVEPRYFIVPWVMWRLHVPSLPTAVSKEGRRPYDLRLVLETVWLLAINAGVGYMFLYRTFEWKSEPGNVQRFLW